MRRLTSCILLAVFLLATDGIVVSMHICCGAVESVKLWGTADQCCCEDDASGPTCAVGSTSDCCQITSALLVLPIGADQRPQLNSLPLHIAPAPIVIEAADAHTPQLHRAAVQRTEHPPSGPLLQVFRL